MNVEVQNPAAVHNTGNETRRRHRQRPPRRPRTQQNGEASVTPTPDASVNPSEASSVASANPRRHPPRGPRNHGRTRRNPTENTLVSPDPSGATPQSSTPQQQNNGQPRSADSSRPRRGRGGRGGDRQPQGQNASQNVAAPTRVGGRRGFGAQLSSEVDGAQLRPDAPGFEPGQIVERPGTSASHHSDQGRRRNRGRGRGGQKNTGHNHSQPAWQASESSEEIMDRIHREIDAGDYECMVCYNSVTRKSKIWYCRCCWAVYHLNCVQKWAKQGLNAPTNQPQGAEPLTKSWRCPACNDSNEDVPNLYTCWCEKSIDPEKLPFLAPHSCGQTCGKKRQTPKDCPHACELQCHAGPCPPCTSLGPPQPCYCGGDEIQRRCIDTDYANGWSCGQVCGDVMPCGEHTCELPCHPGLCGSCEVTEVLRCYCGNEMKDIRCCDKEEPKESSMEEEDGQIDRWDGYYSCGKTCERSYDCGEHSCQKPCHPQDAVLAHCPLSADVVTHCPCGKTKIAEILTEPRTKCTDPIPNCDKECGKKLKCGHACQKQCHTGDCGFCLKTVEINCRCGKTSVRSLCHQGEDIEPPMCMRNCRVTMNCGRHECGAKCCSGEQKAAERIANKKKSRGPQAEEHFESEHICTRVCGRPLKCGHHTCPMLCHRGPCGTCLEASFEELSCNCGRTVIQPPVPCGSKPPACRFPCTRERTCGHPMVTHDCHSDDQPCPKCPYLTEKPCACGKKTIKAVPCFRDTVSCGTVCGKKLSCGSHTCRKVCHTGRCEEPCKQTCGKPRPTCGHGCQNPCHAPFQCPEDKPCNEKVTLQCSCGGIKQEVKCGATKTNPEGNKKEVKCTDACRARRLAMALQLDPDREAQGLYSEDTMTYYVKDKKWCTAIEDKLRSFASKLDSQRLQFQPMRKPLREFIHLLAADYGLESESQDPEPYRAVRIKKGPAFTGAPKKTLAEYLATRPTPAVTAPPTGLQQLKKPRGQAVNAFVLNNIRVGLLANELEKELSPVLNDSQLRFNIIWTGDEDVLLQPKASSLAIDQIESELRNLATKLKRLIASRTLAESMDLCWVGADGKIAYRDGDKWNTVAPKKAAAAVMYTPVPTVRNRFDMTPVPREKKEEKKKEKKKEVEVVEDWEVEAEEDEKREEEERAASVAGSVAGSVGGSVKDDAGEGPSGEGMTESVVDVPVEGRKSPSSPMSQESFELVEKPEESREEEK